jgi:DNA-binding MarR family transcriptional regulator
MSSLFDPDVPPPTIGALLRLAWSRFRRRVFEAVRAAGYDDLQPMHVLLFRYPTIANLRPGQLAEETGVSKQAINDLLRQLEAKGYITLQPDPSDRRARRIVLTPRGNELTECVRRVGQDIAEDWERAVGRQRFDAVRKTLLDYIEAEKIESLRGSEGAWDPASSGLTSHGPGSATAS